MRRPLALCMLLLLAAEAGAALDGRRLAVVPPPRFPNGIVLRCDGQPVRVPRRARDGVLTFDCGRGFGEHVVELEAVP
jgi:hypothetical protein